MYTFIIIIFLSINSALFAMEKAPEPIIEGESSIELVLEGFHHILPLKHILDHITDCQQVSKPTGELTISGFHIYSFPPKIATLKEKVALCTFTPLHQVLAIGDITTFHKGYVVHKGIASVKTFFPVSWQKKDIIAYIHCLMAEGIVDIKEKKEESYGIYKTYAVTISPQPHSKQNFSLYMMIKGCPSIEKSMHILTLFPLVRGTVSYLEADVRELAHQQKAYSLKSKNLTGQQPEIVRIKSPKLIEAVEQQEYQKVLNMLSIGADPEVATHEGVTPLMKAAYSGNNELVSLLLMYESERKTQDHKGNIPLHYAAMSGDFHCLVNLLDRDTLNKQNREGMTPLMLAAERKHSDSVDTLLRFHADSQIQDTYGRTALILATQALYEEKEDIRRCKAIIEIMLEHKAELNVQDNEGNTALMHAVILNRFPLVELLLQAGADFELTNKKEKTALILAKKYGYKLIELCIEQFIQKKRTWLENNKATELMYAAHMNNISKVRKLLMHGVNVNEQNTYGLSLLSFAVENNNIQLVEELLQAGADPRILSPYGISMCEYARKNSSERVTSLLSEAAEKLNAPLREKAKKEKEEQINKYKVLQADMFRGSLTEEGKEALLLFKDKKVSKDDCTPFLYAVREKKHELVQQIIELQCAVSTVDVQQRDAFTIAFDNEDTSMMELLFASGVIKEKSIITCCKRALEKKDFERARFISYNVPSILVKLALSTACEHNEQLFELFFAQNMVKFDARQAGEFLLKVAEISSTSFIKIVLKYYPDALYYANDQGETALMMATKAEKLENVTLLCEQGVHLYHKTRVGRTVFDYCPARSPLLSFLRELEAQKEREVYIVKESEHKQKEIEALSNQGYSSLMIAAYFNDMKSIQADDSNHTSKTGFTALMVAAQRDNKEALNALIARFPALLNAQDNQGCTALHYAAREKKYTVFMTLLHNGASVLMRNKEGKTVFDSINFKGVSSPIKEMVKKATRDQIEKLCRQVCEISQDRVEEEFNALNKGNFFEMLTHEHKIKVLEELLKNQKFFLLSLLFDKMNCADLIKNKELERLLYTYKIPCDFIELLLKSGLIVTLEMVLQAIDKDEWDSAQLFIQKGNFNLTHSISFDEKLMRFFLSCKIAALAFLFKHGLPINIQNKEGMTPLMLACSVGTKEMVKILLSIPNIDINLSVATGRTSLAAACSQEVPELSTGCTPLAAACSQGALEIVELLLQAGAQVNNKDDNEATPLIRACMYKKDPRLVKILIDHGADVNSAMCSGETALHFACSEGVPEIVECLLKAGASLHVRECNGVTPLSVAIRKGHEEIVKLLLALPAIDCEENDAIGNSLLILAVMKGTPKIVRLLLDKGVNPSKQSQGGGTPLLAACEKKDILLVNLLLEKGAAIEGRSKMGGCPLLATAELNCLEIMKILLHAGACPNVQNSLGGTPLIIAAERGFIDMVKLLVEKGVELDKVNNAGCTALIAACVNQHTEIAAYLIKKGASVNIQNKLGNTALILACDRRSLGTNLSMESAKKQEALVQILLQAGVAIELRNLDGISAIDLAGQVGAKKVKKLLMQALKK